MFMGLYGGGNYTRTIRNLERASPTTRRGKRKQPKYEPRDGPKLVRGRGWKRRRRKEAGLIRFVVYVAFAAVVFGLFATGALALLH